MFLGIDLGTSGVKVVVLHDGNIRASHTAPLTTQAPHTGWSEQHPDAWWAATCKALAGLDMALSNVRAIGLSGQMHGAVLLDSDHAVLRPAILWNDNRAVSACADMERNFPDMGALAGLRPLPGLTAPKLLWLQRYEPDIYTRIAHILLPKDYIGLRLHGQIATDHSDAAGTLWYDQERRRWHDGLCQASATNPDWLPPLHNGSDVVGTLGPDAADDLGLQAGLPVVAGAGDAAAGAVSLGATEEGRGFISLGTSGQLFVAGQSYRPNPAQYVHAFAHTVPDRWYQMAAMLNGARPISWLAGQLGLTSAEVAALAAQADPARVPLFLPYLTGERSPHGDPAIRGAFYGLEDTTDRSALCRAVIEAIAFSFADAADSFADDSLQGVTLTAIGGGARSDMLLSLIATATGREITRGAAAAVGPALGAAQLAACGTGTINPADLAQVPPVTDRFIPAEKAGHLLSRRAEFRRLYQLLRTFHINESEASSH